MNNACPSCAAVYSVQAQHIGRRITCKKCGAPLVVTADGIGLDEGLPPGEVPPDPPPLQSSPELEEDYSLRRLTGRPTRATPVFSGLRRWFEGTFTDLDLSLWAFGVGLAVSLVSFFLPLIDQVQVERLRAALQAIDAREARLEREWKSNLDVDPAQRQQALEARARERARLEEQLEKATDGALRWAYACRIGLLIGTMLSAVASLGFLAAGQSSARKVCGAVVLAALAILPLVYLLLAALSGR